MSVRAVSEPERRRVEGPARLSTSTKSSIASATPSSVGSVRSEPAAPGARGDRTTSSLGSADRGSPLRRAGSPACQARRRGKRPLSGTVRRVPCAAAQVVGHHDDGRARSACRRSMSASTSAALSWSRLPVGSSHGQRQVGDDRARDGDAAPARQSWRGRCSCLIEPTSHQRERDAARWRSAREREQPERQLDSRG